ncbi:MAG: AgrD family cyclic lactone autoinducer peptide [Eubacterium sp.]
MAISSLKRDANSTTCTMIYQPKAPTDLKKNSAKSSNDK